MTSEQKFKMIRESLTEDVSAKTEECLVIRGDSLDVLKKIPSGSISLILTDPPYHATKKKNIYGDTNFQHDHAYIDWMQQFSVEWRRILKSNGSFFCFCDSSMAAQLEVMFSELFNVLSHIVWTKPNAPGFDGWKGKMKKESLRQWYPHSERIIFAEPAANGNLHRSPFAQLLRDARKASGLSGHQLTEITGAYGKVNHGGAVSNWETGRNIPSRDQYRKLCAALLGTGNVKDLPVYEDAIRPFNMNGSKQFTDVWTFPSVRPYKGKHPAEKPIEMLAHAIEATTFEGDIVLDCFAGSGNTAYAARNLGRRSIAIEIDATWVSAISNRLDVAAHQPSHSISRLDARTPDGQQEGLFQSLSSLL